VVLIVADLTFIFHMMQQKAAGTMRKLILKMSITLDGFVGGASRELDWIFKTMSDDAAAGAIAHMYRS